MNRKQTLQWLEIKRLERDYQRMDTLYFQRLKWLRIAFK